MDDAVRPVNGEGQLTDAPAYQVLWRIVGNHERAVRFTAADIGTRGRRSKLDPDLGMGTAERRDPGQRD